MLENYTTLWIIIGFICILLEVLAMPGIGLLFVGLGAMSTSVLLELHLIEHQWLPDSIAFTILTAFWAVVLWWPLKLFSKRSASESYQNIVGSVAYVHGEVLESKKIGTVKWSGVIMQAKLTGKSNESIAKDRPVIVVSIKENILYVTKQ